MIKSISKWLVYLLLIFLICLSLPVVKNNIGEFKFYLLQLIYHSDLSYEQKMELYVPQYNFFKFIKENTEPQAIIALPPKENPWLTTGNSRYLRYFLYPRELQVAEAINQIPTGVDYVLISKGWWGDQNNGWPKIKINSIKYFLYNLDTKETAIFIGDYDPITNPELLESWGLIKLK